MRMTRRPSLNGFTLIELVLVMLLLTIVLTMAAPRLEGFAKGRNVGEEARRMGALIRLGRSEAIGRGERMEVWLNDHDGSYGLRPQSEASEDSMRKPLSYRLADRLGFRFNAGEQYNSQGNVVILFLPNGLIDANSPSEFTLTENNDPVTTFKQDDTGVQYVAEDVAGR
jgi:type II secretion system protein H